MGWRAGGTGRGRTLPRPSDLTAVAPRDLRRQPRLGGRRSERTHRQRVAGHGYDRSYTGPSRAVWAQPSTRSAVRPESHGHRSAVPRAETVRQCGARPCRRCGGSAVRRSQDPAGAMSIRVRPGRPAVHRRPARTGARGRWPHWRATRARREGSVCRSSRRGHGQALRPGADHFIVALCRDVYHDTARGAGA